MSTPMSAPRDLRCYLRALRGALILLPFSTHLIIADLLLSALLPVSGLLPTGVYNLSSHIAGPVWAHIQAIFTRFNRARLNISSSSGPMPQGESAVVIANHASWTDFYMIQGLAQRAGMLNRCRWFAKSQLRWVPLLGWGLWAMGMPLVTRDWTHDQEEMERVFGGIKNRGWPIWLIAYSETTRFTPEKYAETVEFCKANGKRIPQHTLYPRHRGFVATVQQLRQAQHVKAVYDITIGYAGLRDGKWEFMAAPSMWESLSEPDLAAKYKFYVHVDRFSLKTLPESDDMLKSWLEDRWIAKGERLQNLRLELEEGFWDGETLKEA